LRNYKILKFISGGCLEIDDETVKKLLKELLREFREMKEDIKEMKELLMDISITRKVQDEINKAISNLGKQIHKLPKIIISNITRDFMPLRTFFYPKVEGYELEDRKKQIEEFLEEIEKEIIEEGRKEEKLLKLDEETIENVAYSIEALSNPDRLKILLFLLKKPRYFSELEDLLEMGPSSLRHHLSKLLSFGLIRQERSRGKYLITKRGVLALLFTYRFYKEIFGEGDE